MLVTMKLGASISDATCNLELSAIFFIALRNNNVSAFVGVSHKSAYL